MFSVIRWRMEPLTLVKKARYYWPEAESRSVEKTTLKCWGIGGIYSRQFTKYRAQERSLVDLDKETAKKKKKSLGIVVLDIWK